MNPAISSAFEPLINTLVDELGKLLQVEAEKAVRGLVEGLAPATSSARQPAPPEAPRSQPKARVRAPRKPKTAATTPTVATDTPTAAAPTAEPVDAVPTSMSSAPTVAPPSQADEDDTGPESGVARITSGLVPDHGNVISDESGQRLVRVIRRVRAAGLQ